MRALCHTEADSWAVVFNMMTACEQPVQSPVTVACQKQIQTRKVVQHVSQVLDDSYYKPRLYLSDSELFEASAVVAQMYTLDPESPEAKKGSLKVRLNQTIFHPQGGGQPADSGTITSVSGTVFVVTFVQNGVDGIVEHIGNIESGSDFVAGESVELVVNEQSRKENIRLHSAGHAIDAAVTRLGLACALQAGKGFHFASGPYVEYVGVLDAQVVDTLAGRLNATLADIIEANIPTDLRIVSKEEAGELCGCDTSNYPDVVRVVTVADHPCPCGGTHVKSTQQLQNLVVTKVKKKKNNVKVSYEFSQ
jgi:Ser-tRNA(Ala) deacylase AlaX